MSIAPDVVVDVDDLQHQVSAARSGESRPTGPRQGFDLELLPGWEEEWVELERERVRQPELHLLDDVVSTSVQDGRHGDGVDAALRAIRLDPWRESSHAGLLRALLAGGNRAAALAHSRRFSTQMREEAGLSPSRDVLEVVNEILPRGRPAAPDGSRPLESGGWTRRREPRHRTHSTSSSRSST